MTSFSDIMSRKGIIRRRIIIYVSTAGFPFLCVLNVCVYKETRISAVTFVLVLEKEKKLN